MYFLPKSVLTVLKISTVTEEKYENLAYVSFPKLTLAQVALRQNMSQL